MNFANHIDTRARTEPERLAVADPRRKLSYEELASETDAVAGGLADRGIEPGDRVALFLPNSVLFMTAYFGTMKRGAIPVPINLRYGPEELSHVFKDADPEALFTVGELAHKIAELNPEVEHFIAAESERGTDYGAFVAGADGLDDTHPRLDTEVAEILYTSGTTGQPKGVKHTHGNLTANAFGTIHYMCPDRTGAYLTVVPCFHAAGLNTTTTPALVSGVEVHFLPEWNPETVLTVLESHDITYTMFVPTMLLDLLEHGTEGYDLSALEWVGVGGSPMPVERFEDVESALGAKLYEGYGMTETTPLSAQNRPGQDSYKPGSVGPIAEHVVDLRIEDPNTHRAVDPGEKGELLWHGDTVMPGYYELPEKNETAFVEREGREWLRSGDIGHLDEDGHLFVDDRIDDMIITGGENVYPREVEDVIYQLDGVDEVAVIGTPHDRLGELVTAVVRGTDVTTDDVKKVCRDRLSDVKIPRRVHFVDDLPRTSTRKISKVALRERFGDEPDSGDVPVVETDG